MGDHGLSCEKGLAPLGHPEPLKRETGAFLAGRLAEISFSRRNLQLTLAA